MNPEFQRNLWLEASPRRLAWAGVVLALVFGVVIFVTVNEGGGTAQALAVTGSMVFFLCAVLWGARAAGSSVLAEISDRTWDFQRLSALTPWTMTWGKLFGATSLAWFCGLTGLVVLVLATLTREAPPQGWPTQAWTLVFMLALAVLVQALMVAAALIGVRKARAEGRVARSGGIVWGLILGGFLLSSIAGTLGIKGGVGLVGAGRMFSPPEIVDWWGLQIDGQVFRGLAVTAFAAWGLLGAWRLMRLELQMRNSPLIWAGFLVFLAIFSGGLFYGSGLAAALLTGGFAVVLCAYAGAFAEPADRVRLRQFIEAVRGGDLKRATPLMPVVVAPTLLYALLVLAAFAVGSTPSFLEPAHGSLPAAPQALAILGFMLRDLAIVAYFRFGPRPQRGDLSAVLALILVYAIGALVGGSVGGETGAALFAPIGANPVWSFASGLIQAVVVWYLAAKRIRAPERSVVSAAPSGPAGSPAS